MGKPGPGYTFLLPWICIWVLTLAPVFTLAGELPAVGTELPEFQLETPKSEEEQAYLGIKGSPSFSITQLKGELVLIEIIGVYCPRCHRQHPLFNKLFYRIKKNTEMYNKTKMIGIAVGANPIEVAYLKKEYRIPYPVIVDPNFEVHKVLGEPRTPFTMLVTKEKKVVLAHLGVIEDMDSFFLQIKAFLQQGLR